ncbi:sulfotransferase family 2 domain-containing protein [Granulosicoccaceae sp. 1_MG-2023]|nr:sulfotransferase family 2 domain-containing protein [Granulosicoccaceae sp. 1_MG-2023]
MNFNRFEKIAVTDFADQLSHSGGLWIFHHIPKTAGSSLTRELSVVLPPYRNVFAEHPRSGADQGTDAMMSSVESFLEADRSVNYRSVSGHFRLPHLSRIREAIPASRMFTFLRQPAERLISDYRYAKTPKHPLYREFAEKFPTIEHYIEDPCSQNKMWRFVTAGGQEAGDESLARIFRNYAFIGTLESLSEDWSFLTSIVGCPKVMTARVNVTKAQDNNEVQYAPHLYQRIRELNAKDYLLYERVSGLLHTKRQEMNEYVEYRQGIWLGAVTERVA